MTDFTHDTSREAVDSLRGYVYQIYQSLYAWMRLKEDEVIFLERAEDFDVESPDTVTATQVKDTSKSGNVTLTSKGCVDALNNFWSFRNDNPGRNIQFRFLTTSEPGRERGASFSSPQEGILYWNQAALDSSLPIGPIRDHIQTLKLNDSLLSFVKESSDEDFRNLLVRPIRWDTGAKSIDALICDIKKRLVIYGDRWQILPFHSQKALGHLLTAVVERIISETNRQLTYADFLECFQSATHEILPKAQAELLRRTSAEMAPAPLPGSSGPGHNNPHARPALRPPIPLVEGATPRTRLIESLADDLKSKRILFLSGSTGVGKTSAANLLAKQVGGDWLWAGFRGCDSRQTALRLDRTYLEADQLASETHIVLDDLSLKNCKPFEQELVSLLHTLIQDGRMVIVTGYHDSPSRILRLLSLDDGVNQSIPHFTLEDVSALLSNHPLPSKQHAPYGKIIYATTGGHPQLVHARVHHYASQNWPPISDKHLTEFDDIEQEREDIRSRIIDDLPSEATRILVHRLSLMTCNFTRQLALDIGKIPAPLSLPGEHFDNLVGPWIERLGKDEYRISPLITGSAKHVFDEQETANIHEGIALSILRQKSADISQVNSCLLHGYIAQSQKALLAFTEVTKKYHDSVIDALAEYGGWFTVVGLEKGQKLIASNLLLDTILRYLQFRIAAASGESKYAVRIYKRWLESINELDLEGKESSLYGLAYGTLLNNINISIPPSLSIDAFSKLVDLSETDPLLGQSLENYSKKPPLIDGAENDDPFIVFAEMIASRLQGTTDFVELLKAMDTLSSSKRGKLFAASPQGLLDFADAIANACWVPEITNESLDVEKTIEALKLGISYSENWEEPKLATACSIAISVLYDEYADDPQSAVKTIAEIESQATKDGRVLYQKGKIEFNRKNYTEALAIIPVAIATGDLTSTDYVFATRHVAIAAAETGDWRLAKQHFLEAAKAARETGTLTNNAIGLETDAAYAAWNTDAHEETVQRLRDILISLESVPTDQSLKDRHLHATTRHLLGWLNGTITRHGSPLSPPAPGLFSMLDPIEEIKDMALVDMSSAWGMLRSIDAVLGTKVDFPSEGHSAEQATPVFFKIRSIVAKFEQKWSKDDVEDAVKLTIGVLEAYHTLNIRKDDIEADSFVTGEIEKLPENYWNSNANVESLLLTLGAIGVKAISQSIKIPTEHWETELHELKIKSDRIQDFLNRLKGTTTATATKLAEAVATALHQIQKNELSVPDTAMYHFRLLNMAMDSPYNLYCCKELAGIATEKWLTIIDTQRFEIFLPRNYCPAIQEVCSNYEISGCAKVAAILEIGFPAAGTHVPPDTLMLLRSIIAKGQDTLP